jgi:hypothetical protein
VNEIGVNLAHSHQRPVTPLADGSQFPKKSRPILLHRAPRVLARESEIQTLPTVGPGDPARTSAETMDKPWNRSQRFGLKNSALSFPESFQRHRNILAMSPHKVTNGKCGTLHKQFLGSEFCNAAT